MNKYTIWWRTLFSRMCPYYDCCEHDINHCDHDRADMCGIRRQFDGLGHKALSQCLHYMEPKK